MVIAIEKLQRVKTVVTHENCPDGIASAILVHDALPEAEIVFCQYGTAKRRELPATEGMLFVDFTPEPSRNRQFVDAGAIVLDHHKGCAEFIAEFGNNGVFADEVLEPGVSGAVLAYQNVWLPIAQSRIQDAGRRGRVGTGDPARYARGFAQIAGIRDTWQRQSKYWSLACEQAEALYGWIRRRISHTSASAPRAPADRGPRSIPVEARAASTDTSSVGTGTITGSPGASHGSQSSSCSTRARPRSAAQRTTTPRSAGASRSPSANS